MVEEGEEGKSGTRKKSTAAACRRWCKPDVEKGRKTGITQPTKDATTNLLLDRYGLGVFFEGDAGGPDGKDSKVHAGGSC